MRHFIVLIVLILHDLAAPPRDIILKLSHSKARLSGMIPEARHWALWPEQQKANGVCCKCWCDTRASVALCDTVNACCFV